MSYLWQEFNIKTFPAETLVFRDGVFCEDLSDFESVEFKENIIYTYNIRKQNKIQLNW